MSDCPTHIADCSQVVKAYQKALFASTDEESVYSALLPKVANIRSTATSTSALLSNISNPPLPDTAVLSGQAQSVSGELLNPENWQEVLQKCIPCDFRINLKSELLDQLPLDFLNDLANLLDQLIAQIDAIIKLLNSGAVYSDLCSLYKFFTEFVCIPDLQRIIALLGAILYRMSVNLSLGLDVIKSLVQPIFLPIFINLTALLQQFISLIVNPLDCIVSAIDLQLEKLDITKGLTTPQVQAIADSATQPGLTGVQTTVSVQKDIGIDNVQFALFSSMRELKGFIQQGQNDLRFTLETYVREINKFVGEVHGDMNFFEIQLEKLKIVRLINFIGAVITILNKGFECNDPPKGTTEEFAGFLNEFLEPVRDITVTFDPITGQANLTFASQVSVNNTLVSTGDSTIDTTITNIVSRATTPVTVKPQCLLGTTSDPNVAKWIAELDGTGV